MEESHKKILWLTLARLLVGGVVILVYQTSDLFRFQPWLKDVTNFSLLALYAFNFCFLMDQFLPFLGDKLRPPCHIGYDILFVSFVVFLTASDQNPFPLLYVLIILYSSLFYALVGTLIVTGTVVFSYLISFWLYLALISPVQSWRQFLTEGITPIEVNVLGFCLVGILAGGLSARLRTTRQRIEEQVTRIQDLEEYNRRIIESLRSGLLTTDAEYRVVTVNRTGVSLLGRQKVDLVGKNALAVFGIDADDFDQHTGLAGVRLEKWLELPEEGQIYVGLSLMPLMDGQGLLSGYIMTFQDLTEIKQLESELELNRKMAAIGELSAAIAHEIRNPLASMVGSVQVLRQQLALTSSQEHLMDIVIRESGRLERTISGFLRYAGKKQFNPVWTDLSQLVRDTLLLFQNSPEAGVRLEIQFKGEGEYPFHGDPDQLGQVIWNLLTNASRAMPMGGVLAVQIRREESWYRITVSDNGKGMDPDTVSKVFEPYQGKFSGGSGLGLAIAYRVVSDHGGKMEVESTAGVGSSFHILLPRTVLWSGTQSR